MARRLYKSFARLEQILQRQAGPTRWLADYQPSNLITDADCPSGTRPSGLLDPYLGRVVQLQALTERPFALLALHNDRTLDIHEQRMLFFNEAPHPLSNHPAARGLHLPNLRGTLDIAQRMGVLSEHPLVRAPKDHPIHQGRLLPYPFIGDILVYLVDEYGPYAVNWSIKATLADFHRSYKRRVASKEDRQHAELRHELERQYYLDGMIPTHHLVPSMVDRDLAINLLNLYYWYARQPLDATSMLVRDDVITWYREHLPKGYLMHDIAKIAAKQFGLEVYDAKILLKGGIFTRRLRVELFCVVADNLPLQPEINDPFVRYAEWFRRST
jgi:hypothetical protein